MNDLPNLLSLLQLESLESTHEGTFLNADQLATIESLLATLEQSRPEMMQDKAALARLDQELSEIKTLLAEKEATIAEMAKGPATVTAGASTFSDENAHADTGIIQACSTLSISDAVFAIRNSNF